MSAETAPETVAEALAGPPDTSPGAVRDYVWAELSRRRQVGYPLPLHGHHPNFRGAGDAAELLLAHLLEMRLLTTGVTVLCYPDMVLKPLRKRLLEAGVSVVVPAKHGEHYRLLKSGAVSPARASSIAGAEREGEDVSVLPDIAFTFVACVAVSVRGEVLTKGYGFRLPNRALGVPSATLAHKMQVLGELEADAPPVSLFATPAEVVSAVPL